MPELNICWRSVFSAGNLQTAYSPLRVVCLPLGLNPHVSNNTVIRMFLCGYSLFLVVFYFTSWLTKLQWCLNYIDNSKMFSKIIPMVIYQGFHIAAGITAICARLFYIKSKEDRLMHQLEEIDRMLLRNTTFSHGLLKRRLMLIIIPLVVWHVSETLYLGMPFDDVRTVGFAVMFMTNIIMNIYFVTTLVQIRSRFKIINSSIIINLTRTENSPNNILEKYYKILKYNPAGCERFPDIFSGRELYSSFQRIELGERCAKLITMYRRKHLNLVTLCNSFIDFHGFYNLSIVMEVIVMNVTLLFLLMAEYFGKSLNSLNIVVVFIFGLSLFWVQVRFLSLSIACQMTSNEANMTSIIIKQIYLHSNLTGSQTYLDNFLAQLQVTKLKFKALGIVPIDNKLIANVTSTVVTYVLILLQFVISEMMIDSGIQSNTTYHKNGTLA